MEWLSSRSAAGILLVVFASLRLWGASAPQPAFDPGKPVQVDDTLADFSSNLPLVVIESFGREIGRDPKVPCSVRFLVPAGGRTKLSATPELASHGLISLRGHTSLRYPKRSFRLKLTGADGQPLKVSVLGLPKESEWVLYAPYPDKTLMRDALAYELSNELGRYAPRTQFVELFVNKPGGPLSVRHYLGVYLLVEKIKRGKDRVPVQKLGPDDNTEPAITGGYILKKDHQDRIEVGGSSTGGFPNGGAPTIVREGFPTGPGGFPADPKGFLPAEGGGEANPNSFLPGNDRLADMGIGFSTPHRIILQFVKPGPDEISAAQRRWLSQYFRQFEAALYGPNFRDPAQGYAAFLDVDSFIDYHWLVETTKNIDGFRFSTFFHKDRNGKLFAGPIWDWNLSFGAANGKQGYMAEHWYWPQLDDQQYSWYRRLFQDPDFAQRYVDRWGELRTNQFATAKILARIDAWAALLDEAQTRNFRKWKILGRQVWPQYYTGKSYADEVHYMKDWITQRLTWIDRQFVPGPGLALQPAAAATGQKATLRAAKGKIYYTLDGSDPRAPGGAVSARALAYKGPVILNRGATLTARALDGQRWSWVTRSSSGVVSK